MAAANRQNRGRVNDEQKMALVEFMEVNPEVNAGIFIRTYTNSDRLRLWNEMTENLNASGPIKDSDGLRSLSIIYLFYL